MSDLEPIQDQLPVEIKAPVYSWSTGAKYFVSFTEKTVVDALVEFQSFDYCKKSVKEKVHQEISLKQIKDILGRPHVQEYLTSKIEEKGMADGLDQNAYKALGYKVLRGEIEFTPEQAAIYKHLSKVYGWEQQGPASVTQINITQQNGEK